MSKSSHSNPQTYFPIRSLSEQTHVGTSTLRAWERRYGLLSPERTPKGHRLYTRSDVKRVLKIVELLKDGHSLPQITDLLSVQEFTTTQVASTKDDDVNIEKPLLNTVWEQFQTRTLDAISDFNNERIDAIYNEASSLYPIDLVTEQLIDPILTLIGNEWKTYPESGIAKEHFYSSWLKNKLGARFHHAYSQAKGTRIICACAPGTFHEIGLMLFSLSALSRGYRVLYFGSNLPLNQLDYIASRSAAKAIVLSVNETSNTNLDTQLSSLVNRLKVPVFVGGNYPHLDCEHFQSIGGNLLGNKTAIAINVFERKIPAYSKV
ncbi:MAG: MerR family transcriptional regulator [Gammaproteobacteria bacterium]|nr:MerR family transcriptional regulator [Gammaproteobacteria bacterium]